MVEAYFAGKLRMAGLMNVNVFFFTIAPIIAKFGDIS